MAENTLYQKIEDDIKAKIMDGSYPPGTQLMPENEMTAFYKVSRITIRNAMINLANHGYIRRVRGKGSFVNDAAEIKRKLVSSDENRTNLLAVILPILDDPHINGIFESLYRNANEAGFSILIYQTYHNQKKEEQCIRECMRLNVQGIIIYPVQNDKYNEEIIKLALARFPLVLIDRTLEGIHVNSVMTDNVKAAYDATNYLIGLGHEKIGLLSSPVEYSISLKNRYDGFMNAFNDAGLNLEQRFVNFKEGDKIEFNLFLDPKLMAPRIELIQEFLNSNKDMTALICTEPIEGVSVMLATREMGIKIPQDLSIIYFDDFKMPDLFYVPPTVVRQDCMKMGQVAFDVVTSLIRGEESLGDELKIDAELIVRQSSSAVRKK